MFANISTGRPAHVASKTEGLDAVAWEMDIAVDTKTNRPVVTHKDGTSDVSEETKTCPNCGKSIPANSARCPNCGKKFE